MILSRNDFQLLRRKLVFYPFLINLFGAAAVFVYLGSISPSVPHETAVRTIQPLELLIFASFMCLTAGATQIVNRRSEKKIDFWYARLADGAAAAEVPASVRWYVLNIAFVTAGMSAGVWFVAGIFFSIYSENFLFSFFSIGGLGGGLSTMTCYFLVERITRPLIQLFFPDGEFGKLKSVHLSVFSRLLLVILLIGITPPVLMTLVTWERLQQLGAAADPSLVLERISDNLMISLIFLLIVSLTGGLAMALVMARGITNPIKELQVGMNKVAQKQLQTKVAVTSQDELGYLGKQFNRMVADLRRGERLQQLLNLYVSPEVARSALLNGSDLGGELVSCTILFSDIRNFTGLTEQLPPQDMITLLNEYMTLMVSVITLRGGIVNKFGGDSLLVLFGTPLNPDAAHAAQAVQTALDMQSALAEFNRHLPVSGIKPLQMGVGIASGDVVAGNIGGRQRIEYTVIGDAVNLASRLENQTKLSPHRILFSEATRSLLPVVWQERIIPLPAITIRGKKQPVSIFTVEDAAVVEPEKQRLPVMLEV